MFPRLFGKRTFVYKYLTTKTPVVAHTDLCGLLLLFGHSFLFGNARRFTNVSFSTEVWPGMCSCDPILLSLIPSDHGSRFIDDLPVSGIRRRIH